MSDWTELSISDIAEINPRESLPKGKIGKKVGMDFLLPFTKRISGFTLEEYKGGTKFRNGDTLLARITPCLENGKTAFVDILDDNEIGFGSTEYIVLREKKNISDKNFLYYLATSPEIRDIAILSMTGSSGRQRVQTNELIQYKVLTPPLPEQKAIADVLSSLDDKIDLLQRQNKTLEQLAQTLFRQWFIEEAQDEWEEGTLDDVLTVKGGTTPSTKVPEYWDGDIHWTTPRDLSTNDSPFLLDTARKITNEGLSKISSGLLPVGTLLLSSRAPVGYLAFSEVPISINQGYIAIIDDKGVSSLFIYLWLKENMDYVVSYANGSTFLEISKSSFKTLEILIPPENLRHEFDLLVNPFFEKIKKNVYQIRTLETLRDTLLPKLISGEVRVCYESFPVQETIKEPYLPWLENAWLAILEVVYRISKQQNITHIGKTIFQKICYIMTEEKGLPLNLAFEKGEFGPFSKQITPKIKQMSRKNLVQERKLGNMDEILLTDKFLKMHNDILPHIHPFEDSIEKTLNLIRHIENTDHAEEVATILYSAKQLKEQKLEKITEQQIMEYVLNWKSHWQSCDKRESVISTICDLQEWNELTLE